jgi:hypothetical protein
LVQIFSPSPNKNKILRFSSIFPISPICFPLGLFLKILPHCKIPLGFPLKDKSYPFNILAGHFQKKKKKLNLKSLEN